MFSQIGVSILQPLNALIIVLGVVVFFRLLAISKELVELKDKTDNAYRKTKRDTAINRIDRSIEMATVDNLDINIMDDHVETFNALGAKYSSWVQIISLFPLMGLFGTILGLIPGLVAVANQDLEPLYSALSTALFSTFWGILAAMILKAYIAFGPSKHINEIESKLAENDRKFHNMEAFNKYTE